MFCGGNFVGRNRQANLNACRETSEPRNTTVLQRYVVGPSYEKSALNWVSNHARRVMAILKFQKILSNRHVAQVGTTNQDQSLFPDGPTPSIVSNSEDDVLDFSEVVRTTYTTLVYCAT